MTLSQPALDGMRVLDVTHYFAGPYCTKMLADHGAEVIKVERPGIGDGSRRLGPFPDDKPDPNRSGQFIYLNAGKLGITLDLKTMTGRRLFERLAADADVVVDNFRPGTMEHFGLGHGRLTAINPKIITCSITSFGETGPYRDFRGTELVVQALGGFVYGNGEPAREPLAVPLPVAQYIAGAHAYVAILAAEALRDVTGRGEHIDVSVMESILAPQEPALTTFGYNGSYFRRVGRRRRNIYPAGILPCKDGFVMLAVVNQTEWQNLANLIGRPDIIDDPRFAKPLDRVANADALDELLAPWLMSRSAREIAATAQKARVPAATVASSTDLLESEHLAVRGYFRTLEDDAGTEWKVPGAPFALGDSPARGGRRAPGLGEHNEQILCERLGMPRGDLPALSVAGVL